ncbi:MULTISPECIES: GNAT family N-acetyltransferase [Streptomyces]|uniref:GNAT family N-acetyltransferase n=1 Tax=Streptomyces sudanensis TaxID=436397 RepID=A0ABY4T8L8_9ACTN|nr:MULTISPECIES: GNAT family N-acetyltransferase [Streptomyces]MCP9957631.1 GNAT family N-acetyltransferase [Streptomyces sudanensis]MCQ0001827.1 GNAT family N-acetyltransferase [Streptomyces sudanensis]URN15318.1 GNAT family N-acetyltransferase [Streptomyces sudanensis]
MSFEFQPTLVGELVEVRPLRAEDFDGLHAVASDPLLWEQHPYPDRHREEVFRAFFEDGLASGGALAVVDRADGRLIGSSRYDGYDPERGEVEIGWTFVARSHWGGAYNGELKRLMLGHAFRFVDAVRFRVGTDNLRSRRAVERLGARLVGPAPGDGGPAHVLYRLHAPR